MSRSRRAIAAILLCATVGVALGTDPVQAAPRTPAAPAAPATYTVKDGDYLLGIAAKLKVKLSDLLTANKLTPSSLIYAGMKLVVPAGGVAPAAAPAAAPATYTVKPGDHLTGIAGKLGVKLSALLTANGLTTSSLILPGQKLAVPAGGVVPAATPAAPAPTQLVYVVRSGDYLSGIAPKLKVKLSDLLSVNKLTIDSMIFPGMKLKVPAGGSLPAASAPNSGSGVAPGTSTSSKVNSVIAFASAQLGEPYQFAAAGPDRWDCSGLTKAAFAEIGIALPHYSGAQAYYGTAIDWRNSPIKAGDLVFLESYVGSGVINHVGIALSATTWIQAPRSGDVVRIGNIPSVRVVAVRRLVQGG